MFCPLAAATAAAAAAAQECFFESGNGRLGERKRRPKAGADEEKFDHHEYLSLFASVSGLIHCLLTVSCDKHAAYFCRVPEGMKRSNPPPLIVGDHSSGQECSVGRERVC